MRQLAGLLLAGAGVYGASVGGTQHPLHAGDHRQIQTRTLHGHHSVLIEAPSSSIEVELAHFTDGCQHVFIDAGANIGMHARFLFEPELYPKSTYGTIFDAQFGSSRRTAQGKKQICAIEFEPNPRHEARHLNLSAAYATQGWRVKYAPYGVSDAPGNLTFYRNGNFLKGAEEEDWTFSATSHGAPEEAGQQAMSVATVDFAKLVDLIAKRTLPERGAAGKIVIKMDIESAEYVVLPHLISQGTLCHSIDHITAEFHDRFAVLEPISFGGHSLMLNNQSQAKEFNVALRTIVADSNGCLTNSLDPLDDESYLHDGVPLPGTAP